MLSFRALGAMGRLGNQLFQYNFLRSQARRLGTSFFCPAWDGDDIFALNDHPERERVDPHLDQSFTEHPSQLGFDTRAIAIADGTDIAGYFQTWQYVDARQTAEWFRFRPDAVTEGRRYLDEVGTKPLAAVHVRLGDFLTGYGDRHYVARRFFYERAMAPVARTHRILVFSDEPRRVQAYLGAMWPDVVVVEGLPAADDLFLMAQCERLACSPSTFSWWAGWLGHRPGREVIVPREGPFRPGAPLHNADYWHPGWCKRSALVPIVDHRQCVLLQLRAMRVARRIGWRSTPRGVESTPGVSPAPKPPVDVMS
jgi:hypothetical protein